MARVSPQGTHLHNRPGVVAGLLLSQGPAVALRGLGPDPPRRAVVGQCQPDEPEEGVWGGTGDRHTQPESTCGQTGRVGGVWAWEGDGVRGWIRGWCHRRQHFVPHL